MTADVEPIVIYRSVTRDGATFALEPRSLDRLREAFGAAVHARDRIFIAHETRADYEQVQGAIAPQIVALLTGLGEERLQSIGGVVFRDPVTERDLPRTAA
jgi:biopolymer transport protein ExbD